MNALLGGIMGVMTTRAPEGLRLVARLIFQPASRYPADPRAIFILALASLFGSVAVALGELPDSMRSAMPGWAVTAWGLTLVAGSVITLIGMAFDSINGVVAEQVGSVCVGVATLFYVVVVFVVSGFHASLPLSIVIGWGLACLVRWGQLQMLINRAYRKQIAEKIKRQIEGA